MKQQQSLHLLLLLPPLLVLLLILSIHTVTVAKQGEDYARVDELPAEGEFMMPEDSSNSFMGFVDCDEECMKRRMMLEAHLDYIYTQNENP